MLGLFLHFAEKLADVGRCRLLAAVALGEGQIVLEHVLHLIDVTAQGGDFRPVAQQRQLKLEAGEHGAQIMAHARQHGGALLDMVANAIAHFQEGGRGPTHSARAARTEVLRHRAALAEGVGGLGQAQDRADLVAQERNRHR